MDGVRLLFAVESQVSHQSNRVRSYQVPSYRAPIHLRYTVSDHSIFWQCLVIRQYDLNEFKQIKIFMRNYRDMLSRGRCPVIIDAGANIGLATVWFARIFPDAHVISIEPEKHNFEILKKNTKHLCDKVTTVNGALVESGGNFSIVNPNSGAASFRLARQNETDQDSIIGYTVDDLMKKIDNGEILIVKIDIEGGQKNLFSSNIGWISKTHLIILELDDWLLPWQATSETFFEAVSALRFDYLIRGENIFCFRHIINN